MVPAAEGIAQVCPPTLAKRKCRYRGHLSMAQGKMYKPQFEAMAASYPKAAFFTCDVDDAPLAAYDAEVVDVPSVVVLPLGLKPDGSLRAHVGGSARLQALLTEFRGGGRSKFRVHMGARDSDREAAA